MGRAGQARCCSRRRGGRASNARAADLRRTGTAVNIVALPVVILFLYYACPNKVLPRVRAARGARRGSATFPQL